VSEQRPDSRTASTQVLVPAGSAEARRFAPSREPSALPPLYARGVGEMLDIAFDVTRARFGTCVLFSALIWVPLTLLHRVGLQYPVEANLLVLLLSFPVQSLTAALVTIVVYGHLQGSRVGAAEALWAGLRHAPALLANMLISVLLQVVCAIPAVAVMAGLSLVDPLLGVLLGLPFFLPLLFVRFLVAVAPAALVLEKLGPIEALVRGMRLVRGGFWRWLGVFTVSWVLILPFNAIAEAPSSVEVRDWLSQYADLSRPSYAALDVLVSSLARAVATAFSGVLLTVFYLDARVRREGFDLTMRLERARERASAAGGRTP
jgi:hypothetical protein